jgi:hypothetical protein
MEAALSSPIESMLQVALRFIKTVPAFCYGGSAIRCVLAEIRGQVSTREQPRHTAFLQPMNEEEFLK